MEDEPIQRSAGLPQQQEKEHTEDQAATHIVFETSNITSGNKNWPTALARKAAVQFVQETCLTKEQMALRTKEARDAMENFVGGPTDPEQGKAAAGVGTISFKGINFIR